MQKNKATLLLTILIASCTAFGADTKVASAGDPQIGDNEIRSEMGSMSKYSLSASIYYGGGALDDPFGATAPNPQNYDSSNNTYMSGTFKLRYRINKMSSVTLNSGLSFIKPFADPQDLSVASPSISYNRTNKMGRYLGRGYITAKYYTDKDSRDRHKKMKITTGYKLKARNVLFKNVTVGISTGIGYYYYDSDDISSYATLWYFNVTPLISYKFNKMFNIKTDFNIGRTNYKKYDSKFKFANNLVSQSIGLGIGFTKEIYLYSYIVTYPENYRLDTATFGMSLNFSLF